MTTTKLHNMRYARRCFMSITAPFGSSVYPAGSAMTPSAWPSTPREQCSFAKSARLLRGLPREIDHPVFVPGFAAVYGAVTLPMGRLLGDPGPGEPRQNVVPSLIVPLAVKIDSAAFKSSAPDQ